MAKDILDQTDEDRETLEAFKKDIQDDADAMDDQREKANEDMRFVNIDGGSWENWYEETFDHPDRVRLELDIISNPLQRFIGEWGMNSVGVDFKPDDAGTTEGDSELLNGIYRSDFRNYSGNVATNAAIMECATVGFGAFKLATVFDDEGDPENDNQHIEWRPIYNAYNTVYWDQSALRIEKRDARHCTVLKQFTKRGFEAEFPGHKPISAYSPQGTRMATGGTLSGTNLDEMIYIATRYEVKQTKTTVYVYNNFAEEKLETYDEEAHEKIKDELSADDTREFIRKRRVVHQICEKTVFSGEEILEETRRIAGKHIPVVPFYGYHAFVDGTERYRGIVRKLKDAQRLFNVQVSQLAENSASAGQEIPIFLREQMENEDIADSWADKNNKPFLLTDKALDINGTAIALGPVGYNKPAALDQSTTALLSIVPTYIKEATGFLPGEAIDKEASGKAIRALMKRENMNTQVINDNISTAIEWSGEIYQAMSQEVYTTRRLIRTLQKDGRESAQTLQQPVMDEETGLMVESNDLRNRKFKSYADVGPQYESVREETVDTIKGVLELFQNTPGGEIYIPALMAGLVENAVGSGLEAVKKIARNQMLLSGDVEPRTDEEKQFVQQQQEKSQQPDAQEEFLKAETQRAASESRNLDAASAEKVAGKGLKEAKTAETMAGIAQADQKLLLEARKQASEQLSKLPIANGNNPQ